MSIFKYQFCPKCGEKTYHRYRNSLRSRFVAHDGWECVSCQMARKKKVTDTKPSLWSPKSWI